MLLEDRWLCTLGSNRAGDGNTLRRIPPDGYSLTANGFGELTGVTISSVAENKGGTYRCRIRESCSTSATSTA